MGTNRSKAYLKQRKAFSQRRTNLENWTGKDMTPKKSKIDPELKAKWVAELRSGKYKQANGRLKTYDSEGEICHCCLGVLCEIVAPDGFNISTFSKHEFEHTFGGKTKQESYPNQMKMREIGLYPSEYKKLAAMNDGEAPAGKGNYVYPKANFNDIADYIEKNL